MSTSLAIAAGAASGNLTIGIGIGIALGGAWRTTKPKDLGQQVITHHRAPPRPHPQIVTLGLDPRALHFLSDGRVTVLPHPQDGTSPFMGL